MRGSILGAAVKRAEDPRFVRGEGRYIDDMRVEGAVWMACVRSPLAHGRITSIDIDEASRAPGVIGVYTGTDFGAYRMPIPAVGAHESTARPIIASDVVRFAGELVAVVVAESREAASDAASLVWPEFDSLPVVVDPRRAAGQDAPLLFPEAGSNVVVSGGDESEDDPVSGAEVVIGLELENQRVAAIPLEPNNALAIPDDAGNLELWVGTQSVHLARNRIFKTLGLDRDRLRVRVPDMGGGFGAKISPYPEQILCAAIALELGRPVRWQEDRIENLAAMSHGRAQFHKVRLGATAEGRITGLDWNVIADGGAYPLEGAVLAGYTRRMAAGPYDIPAIRFRWRGVVTNTAPTDAYRGAGRPEATMTLERLMDLLAVELDLDPVEIRQRNFITEFPMTTAVGERYDSGAYSDALDLARDLVGYDELRTEQKRRREGNDRFQIGIGVSSYVEVTAPDGRKEWGAVEVTPDEVVVYSGASSHGQGHETTFTQLVADVLGVERDRIRFVQGDTASIAHGGGTMGSRSMQLAGSAVVGAGESVIEKARRIAAHVSEAAVEDIVMLDNGTIGVAGVPDSGRSLFQLAEIAADPANLPDGEEPGLGADHTWVQEAATIPFGTHISVVELDTETGDVRLIRHAACDDCGVIFNRMIVDGQVHGGVAQGAGQALLERVVYDDAGNLQNANLTTYLMPTATNLPLIQIDHTVTPTDQNVLGAKGIGEAGTIGSGPAVVNAVHDAMAPFGVRHLDMPLTSARVWAAIS